MTAANKRRKKTLTLNLVYELPTVGRYLHKDSHYTSTLNDQVIQSEASHSRRRHFPRQPRSTTFCLSRISTLSSCRKQKRRWENVNKITMPTRNQFRFIFILFSSHITMMRCFTFYLSILLVNLSFIDTVLCVFSSPFRMLLSKPEVASVLASGAASQHHHEPAISATTTRHRLCPTGRVRLRDIFIPLPAHF